MLFAIAANAAVSGASLRASIKASMVGNGGALRGASGNGGGQCINIKDIIVHNNCGLDIEMVGFGDQACKDDGTRTSEGATCQTVAAGDTMTFSGSTKYTGKGSTRLYYRFSWFDDKSLTKQLPRYQSDYIEMNADFKGPHSQLCTANGTPNPSFSSYNGFSMSAKYIATKPGANTPACDDAGAAFTLPVASCPSGKTCSTGPDFETHCPSGGGNAGLYVCPGEKKQKCTDYAEPNEMIIQIFEHSKCWDGSGQCTHQGVERLTNFHCGSPLLDPNDPSVWKPSGKEMFPAGTWFGLNDGDSIDLHIETCTAGDWARP